MLGYVGDASSMGKHILSDKMSIIFQHILPVVALYAQNVKLQSSFLLLLGSKLARVNLKTQLFSFGLAFDLRPGSSG